MSTNVNTPLPIGMLPNPKRTGQDMEWKSILLRMPVDLFKHIDAAAEANYRSRTAEILVRLEATTVGESLDEHGVIVRRVQHLAK